MTALLAKLLISLNLLSVALAALPPTEIILEPTKTEVFSVSQLIEQYFPGHEYTAKRIAQCESSNDPLIKNKNSSATGIYQILRGTWNHYSCSGDILNAEDNIRCASRIFEEEGDFGAWSASKGCWSKNG